MKKGEKQSLVLMIVILLIIPLASAGIFSDIWGKISGKATDTPVDLNLTITGSSTPTIQVHNATITDVSSGPSEGPTMTPMEINYTVYDGDGFGNINDATAQVNFSIGGYSRANVSCENTGDFETYYSNYTCRIVLAWYDTPGAWTINATISDNDANRGENSSTTFTLGTTTGFTAAPSALTWTSITAGATNQESNNDPVLMNNTGNVGMDVEVNATNLRGELDSELALWAGNFTVKNAEGCEGTAMSAAAFVNVTSAVFSPGNFSINDDSTGQEQIFFCLEEAGSELTAQSYSTANEGAWTIQITS